MTSALAPLLDLIYPPECAGCRELTDAPHGLCPTCWADTAFITGSSCDCCGTPLPTALPGDASRCETCTSHPPGWDRGRAAILYEGAGKQVVLRLKHGDRLDLARVLARWMIRAGAELLGEADVVAPVPLHWSRMIARRYNQAAELARAMPGRTGMVLIPDLLVRTSPTPKQVAMDRATRYALQSAAFRIHPRRADRVAGKTVLLIDDVMTSGATLAACTAACRKAGASRVLVLVAARVAREGFAPI